MKLMQVIETPFDAIFCAMNEFDVPWKEENICTQLDIHYLLNISGQKNISNMVTFFINTETGKIEDEDMTAMVKVILSLYLERWTKLYATFSFQYDPISNYDMEEKMTNDITTHAINEGTTRVLDSDGSFTHGKTDTTTNNLTDSTQHGKTDTTTNNLNNTLQHIKTDTVTNNLTDTENGSKEITKDVSAFNADNYVPAEDINETITNHTNVKTGTQSTSTTGSDVEINSGTQATSTTGTDTITHTGTHATVASGTDTDTKDETEIIGRNGLNTDTRNYTLTRKGNIGVTTSQDMIKSERELWLWDFFHTVVFPDIDRVITLPYYGGV